MLKLLTRANHKEATDEEIETAAKHTNFHNFILGVSVIFNFFGNISIVVVVFIGTWYSGWISRKSVIMRTETCCHIRDPKILHAVG